MGCMGNGDVKTPNLDRLAGEGVLMRNTFANTPVCCPARAILFTGTYGNVNGRVANDLRLSMRPNWVAGVAGGSKQDVAAYYAACTAIDDQMGRLMGFLKDRGLERDTIVVFTSDHGDMLGSQGRRLKRVPWEESIKVPGIVRWPGGIGAGRTSEALLTHVDVAPTLLSLCGVAVPADMQGTDLSPVLLSRAETGPASAFFQQFVPYRSDRVDRPWRAVRTARYLYARTRTGPWLMYDLKEDPYERNNLVNDAGHEKLRTELDAQVAEWMRRTGDSWAVGSEEFVDDGGRLYKTPRAFYTLEELFEWERGAGKP